MTSGILVLPATAWILAALAVWHSRPSRSESARRFGVAAVVVALAAILVAAAIPFLAEDAVDDPKRSVEEQMVRSAVIAEGVYNAAFISAIALPPLIVGVAVAFRACRPRNRR